jgi:four helix bundle protein
MIYDLEERTKNFSIKLLLFIKTVKINSLNNNIILQLSRSATAIGANYREANGASSRKDFKNKVAISRKEAKETEYWIEILASIEPILKSELRIFWKEAHELVLVFGKIYYSLDNKFENLKFNIV